LLILGVQRAVENSFSTAVFFNRLNRFSPGRKTGSYSPGIKPIQPLKRTISFDESEQISFQIF
jgi:hypothetical protein